MRAIAERLSSEFAFVRVDLYSLGERIVVGEMTHYPTGGNKSFEPPDWDDSLGALWPLARHGARRRMMAVHRGLVGL